MAYPYSIFKLRTSVYVTKLSDIEYIAVATNNDDLFNSAQVVFNAASYVKTKHREAGRLLTKKLKEEIADALQDQNNQRYENLLDNGDPYEMEIEGIGKTIILKIKSIKDKRICVDASKTNCLLKNEVFYG